MTAALGDDVYSGKAVDEVGKRGTGAKSAVPQLLAAMAGRSQELRARILEAARRIEPTLKLDLTPMNVVARSIDAALDQALKANALSENERDRLFGMLGVGGHPIGLSDWTDQEMIDFVGRLGAIDGATRDAFAQKAVSLAPRLERVLAARN